MTVKWLLTRLTVEDFIALMYLSKYGPLTFAQLEDMCLRVDIFCDTTYLARLGLVRKKDGAYETTKKADEFLELVYELLKHYGEAETVAEG
ncbi:MAG: hypothetical protein ACO2PN_15655 [Pyrobaculum sp.]|jgi:hypothetical protein